MSRRAPKHLPEEIAPDEIVPDEIVPDEIVEVEELDDDAAVSSAETTHDPSDPSLAEAEEANTRKSSPQPATALLPPSQATLDRYFHDIKRVDLLSSEEEHELAVSYQDQGDKEAAYRLVTANLRLVVKIAMEYRQAQIHLLDLIQEGNIGLLEAVKRFDPYRGVKLSTYAAWWIRAYILKYLLDNWSLVRIGTTRAQKKLFFRLNKEKQALEQQGYTVGPKLLAERLNVKEEEVVEMEQRLGSWAISLDEPAHRESSLPLAERLAHAGAGPEEEVADAQFHRQVRENILAFRETLRENEKLILDRRNLAEQPETLQVLGDRLGVTRERARQIEARMLAKLKTYLQDVMPEVEDHVE